MGVSFSKICDTLPRARSPGAGARVPGRGGAWMVGALGAALWFTARLGPGVHGRTGKPLSRQIGEQLRLAYVHRIEPSYYYMFEFYDDGRRARADRYILPHHRRAIFRFLRRLFPPVARKFGKDKVQFQQDARANGLAAVPVLAVAVDGNIQYPDPAFGALPDMDLFVKPVSAFGGYRAERWVLGKRGMYFGMDNKGRSLRALSKRELAGRLKALSVRRALLFFIFWRKGSLLRKLSFPNQSFLVQPRIVNHPGIADLSNGALNTVRVLTILDEGGRGEMTHAVFKMAVGANQTVDHMHAGGLVSAVDIANGKLGPASDLGLSRASRWHDRHPDTGAEITGRKLPMWDDVCDLVERAHTIFNHQTYIGWDVALSGEGPVLVEGNGMSDLDIIQRAYRAALGEGRFGEIVASQVNEALRLPEDEG